MADQTKPHFWRGPVTTVPQARRIIVVTGWVFVGIVVMGLLGGLTGGQGPLDLLGDLIIALLLGVPAAFLLSLKNRFAAAVLFGMALLVTLSSVAAIVFGAVADGLAYALALSAISLFWAMLTYLSWRALKAAAALRQLKGQGQGPAVAAVFD